MNKAIQNSSHWVYLINQEKYEVEKLTRDIGEVFDKENIQFKGKTIFLKPSFVLPLQNYENTKMIVTNPKLIAAVTIALLKRNAKMVYIGESETTVNSRYAFQIFKIKKLFKHLDKKSRQKIELCYLEECFKENISIKEPFIPDISFNFPKILCEVDFFISMPKLKVNIFAGITLSVKNNLGLISKKERLMHHSTMLHHYLADLYQIRPPDFVITDAIIAGEGQGPLTAKPYALNSILIGNNGLAVDSICCKLMGQNPHEVVHLKLLSEKGFGELDLNKIRIVGEKLIKEKVHLFDKPKRDLGSVSSKIKIIKGECCESGCEAFIQNIFDTYGRFLESEDNWEKIKAINIIMGKNIPISDEIKSLPKRNTVVYGDCAKEFKKYGYFFKGCPPDYVGAILKIPLKTHIGFSPMLKDINVFLFLKTLLQEKISKLMGLKYK